MSQRRWVYNTIELADRCISTGSLQLCARVHRRHVVSRLVRLAEVVCSRDTCCTGMYPGELAARENIICGTVYVAVSCCSSADQDAAACPVNTALDEFLTSSLQYLSYWCVL